MSLIKHIKSQWSATYFLLTTTGLLTGAATASLTAAGGSGIDSESWRCTSKEMVDAGADSRLVRGALLVRVVTADAVESGDGAWGAARWVTLPA